MTALERIDELCRNAEDEGETIDEKSLRKCRAFFQHNPMATLPRPRITLTPDGKFRAHWGDFGMMREF